MGVESIKDRKASLSARREGIDVSQLKTVFNDKLLLSLLLSRTLFFTDLLVFKRDFSVTVQYPCKLFTLSLLNSYFPIFTHKIQ